MRDWKEIAEFCTGKFAWIFGNLQRVGVLLFWKRETVCLWNLKLATCEFVFGVIFIHVNGDLWSLLSLSCIHACNSWFDDLSEGYCRNHFDQLTISCLHFMYMTVVCVAVSVDSVVFLHGLPWNGDPWVFIFVHKSFQFPMDWGWGDGFKKIRKDIWSRIAVKRRVRRIPVCWKHLEFWETFLVLCFMLNVTWCLGSFWLPKNAQALPAKGPFR